MNDFYPDAEETEALLQKVRDGDASAINTLFDQHRAWVRRIVEARLDTRVRRRVDPSDVVQEVQLEAAKRIDEYLSRNPMPFHLWLRQTAYDNIVDLARKHLQAECRTVEREAVLSQQSSIQLAHLLMAQSDSPDQRLLEQELANRIRNALSELDDGDRELVLMRVCEGLDNQDVSQILQIHPSTGSKRFGRVILQLRSILLRDDSRAGEGV